MQPLADDLADIPRPTSVEAWGGTVHAVPAHFAVISWNLAYLRVFWDRLLLGLALIDRTAHRYTAWGDVCSLFEYVWF